MSAPSEPRVQADTGGLVVTDDGRRVLVIDRGTGALSVLAFVFGVLALVVGGFGCVALIAGIPSRALGATLLAVGFVFAAAAFAVVHKIRRRRGQPLHECRPVGVLDRKLGLFSYCGGAVMSLDQVRFARKFQIGTSSPKLVAVTPGGTKVLKRGNPFDGGVGNVDEVLAAVVSGGSPRSGRHHPPRAVVPRSHCEMSANQRERPHLYAFSRRVTYRHLRSRRFKPG